MIARASPPPARRAFLARAGSCAAAWLLGAGAWLRALPALAAERNRAAFEAKTIEDALVAAGVADAVESADVILRAPDIAENSAIVHVEIESRIPETRAILLFAEKNPQPFVAQFDILPGMDPYVAVRIKMADSAALRAVVLAGDRRWFARRETKVTIGGCAG